MLFLVNNRRIFQYLFVVLILLPGISRADKASKINDNGIKAYNEQKLDESIDRFTEALVERPDSPELRFNRGTALSAAGKKEEALNELEKSAGTFTKKELSAAAHYNAGNTFFSSGDLKGAIDEYKKAVKLDQSSPDIRHNLELALRMLKEQQQDENQEEEDQNKNDQNNENQNNDEEKEDEDQKQDDQQNESKNDDQQNQEQQQQDQQNQQQPEQQQPMTPEEAQRILDAMNDEEEKALDLRRKMMINAIGQGDDW